MAVLTKLNFEVFLKGEYIIRTGTKGDRMYFIRSGVVDVLTDDGEIATSLSDGAHFGEICLLTEDRRVASVVSATIVDLFSLSKTNFQLLLDEYPEMRSVMERIALRRLNKLGKNIPTEEIRQRGRISTNIPPPHISREISEEDLYDGSDTEEKTSREFDGSYLGSLSGGAGQSSSPSRSRESCFGGSGGGGGGGASDKTVSPLPKMDLSDAAQPSPPSPPAPAPASVATQPRLRRLPALSNAPASHLPPLELEMSPRRGPLVEPNSHRTDPHFVEYSNSDDDDTDSDT